MPLAAGILFLPMVFAWFLLRRGHSSSARTVGFSWMAIIAVVAALQPPATVSVQAASTASQDKTAAPAKLAVPAKQRVARAQASPTPDSSEQDLKRLYEQLQSFRRDPAFLDVGFDICCRFNQWLQNVRQLKARNGIMIINDHKVVTGELETLAFNYMRNEGRSTEIAAYFERQFELALYPPKRRSGSGLVHRETRGCRSFELFAQFSRLAEEGDFATSSSILEGPGCEKVPLGTQTGPVIARRLYTDRDGDASPFVLVQLSGSRKVWMSEYDLVF